MSVLSQQQPKHARARFIDPKVLGNLQPLS